MKKYFVLLTISTAISVYQQTLILNENFDYGTFSDTSLVTITSSFSLSKSSETRTDDKTNLNLNHTYMVF